MKVDIEQSGLLFGADVHEKQKIYSVLYMHRHIGGHGIDVNDLECSCHAHYYYCRHLVALMFAAHEKYEIFKTRLKSPGLPLDQWLDLLTPDNSSENIDRHSPDTMALTEQGKAGKLPSCDLIYALIPNDMTHSLSVRIDVCRVLKRGGYGKPQDYRFGSMAHEAHRRPVDRTIIADMLFLNRDRLSGLDQGFMPGALLSIKGRHSSECLERMINTGRCFLDSSGITLTNPLSLGKKRPLNLTWELLPDASQKLTLMAGDSRVAHLLFLDEIMYISDKNSGECGYISTEIESDLIKKLIRMPPIPHDMVDRTIDRLKSVLPDQGKQFLPVSLGKPMARANIKPIPEMRLTVETVPITGLGDHDSIYFGHENFMSDAPVMTVHFDYGGYVFPFSVDNTSKTITYIDNGVVYTIERDLAAEKNFLLSLEPVVECVRLASDQYVADVPRPDKMLLVSLDEDERFLEFIVKTLPRLEKQGWRVHRQHHVFSEVVFENDMEWYSELGETAQLDFFSLKLGILVNGKRVNLLPLIADLFQKKNLTELNEMPENEAVYISLPNEKILAVLYGRIKPMLSILVELFDSKTKKKDELKLSNYKSSLLVELKKAIGASRLRWFGNEKLRAMAEKMAGFTHVRPVKIPDTFRAKLRNYQREGVNWLQFLREYQMGGILADDMGLGKTVQTLAHLSVEKSEGRLAKPVLIIAPTSLMGNWMQEAARFSPDLSVLVFHGDKRHARADKIAETDIVLTTYSLLARDMEHLMDHEFYYVILDEAQFIKNHRTKNALIVQRLNSSHRLCLTGTPMENHLGEMWSLFNFLMPGFLGDMAQFKRLFRVPIEKHDDDDRRRGLAMRVKPFLLRRQKRDVLPDLPDKTEIIHAVNLLESERDLYESVRLSMEERVRAEISKNGLARSHIAILDALLKLRQICCHPRLLKLNVAERSIKHSSKMTWLQESLPGMVAEGRKILIFSQFVSMLSIIEETLPSLNIGCVKLTGATKNRKKVIDLFKSGKASVFLISLKAGGTGLNLTEADTVIHYDPWWNPSVEDQATDRTHRIGQGRAVFVYKLIARGTVEEVIQEMQERKRKVVGGLLSSNHSGKLDISPEDLNNLFKPIG